MKMHVEDMLEYRSQAKVLQILRDAKAFAEARIRFTWFDLQNALKIGHTEAVAVHDWLSDRHLTDPTLSTHIVRCGRRYVMNNPFPTLSGMCEAVGIGDRRGFAIMLELERRTLIRIGANFTLERVKRMSSWDDLIQQLRWVAKKYSGRCEPSLLMRILYVDKLTAIRLAQYGEEHLDLRWKNRPRALR